MKAIQSVIVLFIVVISLSSCKKDYICSCTFSDATKNFDRKIENISRKNDALVICNDYSAFVGNCKLK
jgi:hypothetical protein